MKILLVGESSVATRLAEKLRAHGEVQMVTPQHFNGVPQGTDWVLTMRLGGPIAARVHAAAGQAKVHVVSIPTGWSHVEAKLARVGFFTRREEVPAPLVQRPFAHIADALAAQREREREEAERKAAAAIERGLNPPPLTEEEEEALTRPDPLPPAPEASAVEVEHAVAHPRAVDGCPACRDREESQPPPPATIAAEPPVAKPRRVYGNVPEKEARLRQLFEWNPDLALSDAQAMLAAVASDGRALNWTTMSEIRRQIRAAKGLPTDVRRFTQIEKRLAPMNGGSDPIFTPREDEGPVAPASTPGHSPAPPTTPSGVRGYALPLPPAVDAASRLLGEELERAGEVESFTLTFQRGERPKIRWRPNVEGSVEL